MVRVTVKSITGRTYTLEVQSTTTVLDLKTQVSQRENIRVENVRLIVGGRQLEDGKTLGDYDMSERVNAYMVLRLRGGGPDKDEDEGIVEAVLEIGDKVEGNE